MGMAKRELFQYVCPMINEAIGRYLVVYQDIVDIDLSVQPGMMRYGNQLVHTSYT